MVEIIPKPAAKLPLWPSILFYFSLVLLLLVVASFFVLNHFIKKSEETLSNLETTLVKEKTPTEIALEEEIFNAQKKFEDIAFLLNLHSVGSRVFELFEKVTHPKVWINKFNLNLKTHNVEFSGFAENFQTLGQQLLILKRNQLVKNVNLTEVSIGREGRISFTFTLSLDSQVFTPQ